MLTNEIRKMLEGTGKERFKLAIMEIAEAVERIEDQQNNIPLEE